MKPFKIIYTPNYALILGDEPKESDYPKWAYHNKEGLVYIDKIESYSCLCNSKGIDFFRSSLRIVLAHYILNKNKADLLKGVDYLPEMPLKVSKDAEDISFVDYLPISKNDIKPNSINEVEVSSVEQFEYLSDLIQSEELSEQDRLEAAKEYIDDILQQRPRYFYADINYTTKLVEAEEITVHGNQVFIWKGSFKK